MTEVLEVNAVQDNHSSAPVQQLSAGAILRQAREARQMSVQSLASTLKVPVFKLQALEEDRWEVLTDSVFTRSLALSVCRVLRIQAEPVLAGLPKLEGAKLSSNPEGINAPFKEKSLRSLMSPSQEPSSGKLVKVAVALLIAIAGGAGLYFLPQWQASEEVESADVAEAKAPEPLFMPASSTTTEPATESVAAPAVDVLAVTPALVEPVLKDAITQAPTNAEVTKSDVVAEETVAVASEQSKPVAVPGAAVLRFSATGETWVQVRDIQKRVVMERILKAGDVYEETVTGRPLQVVVGNTGATKLEIDGAAFDLAALAKNNVARFEVK